MSQVAIENPIIDTPFDEPARHFLFTEGRITNEIVDGRRTSSSLVLIAKTKNKRFKQLNFVSLDEVERVSIQENRIGYGAA